MFKKIFLSIISVILLSMVLCCALPISALAEQTTATYDEVHYSDLFYGYKVDYLRNKYFVQFADDTDETISKIYSDYLDSPKFVWTSIREGISAATDLNQFLKIISDAGYKTDITYQEAVDAANVAFVQKLLVSPEYCEVVNWAGMANERASMFFDVYGEFAEEFNESVEYEKNCYRFLKRLEEKGAFSSLTSDEIKKVYDETFEELDLLGPTTTIAQYAYESIQAVSVALMMEDLRLEVIDCIIENSSRNQTLYSGMTRLRNQLRNGFLTYFTDTYLKDAAIGLIVDFISDKVTGLIPMYGFVTACIDLLSWVSFDLIFDIPEMEDMFVHLILSDYYKGLYYAVQDKIEVFENQFTYNDVKEFETLMVAYIAATKAAMEACEPLAISSNRASLDALNTVYGDFTYSTYIKRTTSYVKSIPSSERLLKSYDSWTVNNNVTITDSSDYIAKNELYAINGVFKGNLIINGTASLYEDMVFDGSVSVNYTNGKFYTAKNTICTINGNINTSSSGTFESNGRLNLRGDANIGGNFYSNGISYISGKLNVNSYGNLTNNGTLTTTGTATINNRGVATNNMAMHCYDTVTVNSGGTLNNKQAFTCYSDFIMNGGTFENEGYSSFSKNFKATNSNSKVIQTKADATIYAKGEFSNLSNNGLISGGTVYFDGDTQQKVDCQVYNAVVLNPKGIDGTVRVYGHFDLRKTKWSGTIYAYDGASFADGSYYNNVIITEAFTMRSNINADVEVRDYKGNLTVPKDSNYTIGGNFSIICKVNSSYNIYTTIEDGATLSVNGNTTLGYYANLHNFGTLNCYGDLILNSSCNLENSGTIYCHNDFETTYSYAYVKQSDPNAKIYLRGNLSFYNTNNNAYISGGTFIFDGTKPQTLIGQVYNAQLLNKNTASGTLYVYGHIDLLGNTWSGTIYAYDGASFADGSYYNNVIITEAFTMRSNINADVEVRDYKGNLTVPKDSNYTIGGNFSIICKVNSSYNIYTTIEDGATLSVNGNTTLGYCANLHNFGTLNCYGDLVLNSSCNLENSGTIYCHNDFETTYSYAYVKQSNPNAKIYLRGNLSFSSPNNNAYVSGGTFIFDGTKPQTLIGQVYNAQLINKNTASGTLYVYGHIDLLGNTWSGTIYAYDGASFADGSYYNNVIITEAFTMRSNINADVEVRDYKGNLTVPKDSNYTIGGNFSIICKVNSTYYIYTTIEDGATLSVNGNTTLGSYANLCNFGTLNCYGDLVLNSSCNLENSGTIYCHNDFETTYSYAYVKQSVPNSAIYVFDNANFYSKACCQITAGKFIFAGNKIQNVSNLNAPTIIIDKNLNGIVRFSTAISPSVLFNHKGNMFILANNSVFVDYDYDGLSDEQDPDPTDFNANLFIEVCDVNDDGSTDIRDLIRIKQDLADGETSDITGDGNTDVRDLRLVKLVLIYAERKQNLNMI